MDQLPTQPIEQDLTPPLTIADSPESPPAQPGSSFFDADSEDDSDVPILSTRTTTPIQIDTQGRSLADEIARADSIRTDTHGSQEQSTGARGSISQPIESSFVIVDKDIFYWQDASSL